MVEVIEVSFAAHYTVHLFLKYYPNKIGVAASSMKFKINVL